MSVKLVQYHNPTPLEKRQFDLTAIRITNYNSFNEKVRRIVRAFMISMHEQHKVSSYEIGLEGLSQVMDSSRCLFLRAVWMLVMTVCFSICIYQIYRCGAKYHEEPVVADVVIEQQNEVVFPSISICNSESDGLYRMWDEASPDEKITTKFVVCLSPTRELLGKATGLSVEKMWSNFNTSATISVMELVGHHKKYNPIVKEDFSLLGSQATFGLNKPIPYEGIYSKYVVQIRKILGGCYNSQIMGSLQSFGMPPDLRTAWTFTSLLTFDMMFTMQKYEFVNRRQDPCVDDDTHFRCKVQCAVETFKNFSCRFPFLPKEVDLPTCTSGGEEIKHLFTKTLVAYARMSCTCPRLCRDTAFSVAVNIAGKNENVTKVTAYFLNNIMTTTKERFSYDIISLLSDIGGNLGLCLGFSLLSIFQFIQGIFKLAKSSKKSPENRRTPQYRADPILRQVNRILTDELHSTLRSKSQTADSSYPIIGLSIVVDKKAPFVLRILWLTVIVICIIGYCFFFYLRVMLYLSDPTIMSVEITKAKTVTFPNLTICGNMLDGIKIFRKLAMRKKRFRRLPSGKVMPDWCSLQLPDMLQIPSMKVHLPWDFMSVYEEHERADDIGEFVLKYKFLQNVTSRPVLLPEGKCAEMFIGEQVYAGTNTLFSKLTISRVDENSQLYAETLECDRSYHTVYITPPNETFHFNTRLIYAKRAKTMLMMETKKVTHLNLRRRPCTDPQTANQCITRCFEKILQSQIICSLPYMPDFPNGRNCTNATEGKSAHNAYMDVALTFDPYVNCSCVRSCSKIIISTAVYTEPIDLAKMTVLGALFFTNLQQHVIEVKADDRSKLLCDLGGNLGIALGVSLLSIFSMIQSLSFGIFRFLCEKCRENPKRIAFKITQHPQNLDDLVYVTRSKRTDAYAYVLFGNETHPLGLQNPSFMSHNEIALFKKRSLRY